MHARTTGERRAQGFFFLSLLLKEAPTAFGGTLSQGWLAMALARSHRLSVYLLHWNVSESEGWAFQGSRASARAVQAAGAGTEPWPPL